eukprot:SAG22_NODE_67_length_22882_cov_25.671553_6_plen_155_part_00
MDVESADLVDVSDHTDVVMLIQTKHIMSQPRSLSRLYAATSKSVPIIPIVLLGEPTAPDEESIQYDFETAQLKLEELKDSVSKVSADAIREATGDGVADVGIALSKIVPQIISKPLGVKIDKGELDTQMGEIERVLRAGTSTAAPKVEATAAAP